MDDKLLYIPNDDSQNNNQWLKCLDTKNNDQTIQNLIKVSKFVKSMNQKTFTNNFGDQCKCKKKSTGFFKSRDFNQSIDSRTYEKLLRRTIYVQQLSRSFATDIQTPRP